MHFIRARFGVKQVLPCIARRSAIWGDYEVYSTCGTSIGYRDRERNMSYRPGNNIIQAFKEVLVAIAAQKRQLRQIEPKDNDTAGWDDIVNSM